MDQILEKIKKLLRMKRGGTPAEIETAMALAAELARKHNIDLENVDPDQEGPERQPLTTIDAITASRLGWECKYAGLVCERFFNVDMVLQRRTMRGWKPTTEYRLIFAGAAHDIAIAQHVFGYLVGHFRRSWAKRANKRLRNRTAFWYGMYHGLCYKLDQQKEKQVEGVGIIALNHQARLRKSFVLELFPHLKSTSCRPDGDATAAKYAGLIAGQNTEVRAGISGGDKPSTLMLGHSQTSTD